MKNIANITVYDLAKLHLPCIYGKVLQLNVEFHQSTYYSTKRKLINTNWTLITPPEGW